MKKVFILLLLVVCLLGAASFIWLGGSSKASTDAHVIIKEGSGAKAIAKEFKDKGVFRSEEGFLLRLMTSPYRGKLQYGEYDIKEGTPIHEVFEMMVSGRGANTTINITVPEGYTAEQIGALCEKKGLFSKEDFLKAVSDKEEYKQSFLAEIKENADKEYILQGYLYPDTYNVYKDASPEDVVNVMLDNFSTQYGSIDTKNTDDSMDEIVIKASIIEKETAVASERATVAGVIENRLEKGMRLEVCPSALYPITKGMYDQTTVSYKDTKVKSPYNTYVNKGLPVGPICNPSKESMEAALNPEKHEYFFYHTKEEGSKEHIFTKTYEEHMKTQK